jgi:hypothetical protein
MASFSRHVNSYLQMFMHFVSLFCALSHLERAETVLGLSVSDFLLSFARFTLEKVAQRVPCLMLPAVMFLVDNANLRFLLVVRRSLLII